MISSKNYPTEAIIAVTLNCNARCVMCNIWQNRIPNEVTPDFYKRLPSSLKEINITGGEPFLRPDLPEVIKTIHESCPQARLVISTNGYLKKRIESHMAKIYQYVPNIGLRVSLDGFGHTHDNIRRLPHFFDYAMESLEICKNIGLTDLGISFTLMKLNTQDLLKMYSYCRDRNMEFSLTVATDSPIYFGTGKITLRPEIDDTLKNIFNELTTSQYKSTHPKNWIRAWFNKRLLQYIETNTRSLTCHAGDDFFYLDSLGRIYACHIKPWEMGNLQDKTFEELYFSERATKFRSKAKLCNDCWMVCSARASIKGSFAKVLQEVISEKLSSHLT